MFTTRTRRMALIPVTAAALALTVAGCKEDSSASSEASESASSAATSSSAPSEGTPSGEASSSSAPSGETSSRPAGDESSGQATAPGKDSSGSDAVPATKTPCTAGATTLLGKLDGDPYPDKITDPDHTGTKMTVQWGNKDGSYDKPVTMSSLIGVNKGEVGAVAVADFHNKGTLDMLVSIVEPSGVDDPGEARVAEFRSGPVNRSDMLSSHPTDSDIGQEGEVQALQVADYNGDEYPDVAVLHNVGDGQVGRNVRLSVRPGGGLDKMSPEANEKYGDSGDKPHPPAMPTDGWTHFYKSCS